MRSDLRDIGRPAYVVFPRKREPRAASAVACGPGLLLPQEHWFRPYSTSPSIASAISMSRSESPPASCVVRNISTRLSTFHQSGCWSARPEERSEGKGCGSPCRLRGSPYHYKHNNTITEHHKHDAKPHNTAKT